MVGEPQCTRHDNSTERMQTFCKPHKLAGFGSTIDRLKSCTVAKNPTSESKSER